MTAVGFNLDTARSRPFFTENDSGGSILTHEAEHLLQLMTALCEDIEAQVKPNLIGRMAEITHEYLPQIWVFETECGACTLFLDTEGTV